MKEITRKIAFYFLASSLLISSCGPGQVFGSTLTPTPTLTLTSTSSPTNTVTPEPTGTKTPIPIPACKEEVVVSDDLKDWFLMGTISTDAKKTTEIDNGDSVAKVIQSKGYFDITTYSEISNNGKYLISVYVKREKFETLKFEFFDENQDNSTGGLFFLVDIPAFRFSDTEYTRITKTFSVTTAPTKVRFGIGAEGNVLVWLKNLQICLIE